MDTMDNYYKGKYDSGLVIIDGLGWAQKVGPGGFRKVSFKMYQNAQDAIKNQVETDLMEEMEDYCTNRAKSIFDFCWDKAHRCGLPEVISWFRELLQIVS